MREEKNYKSLKHFKTEITKIFKTNKDPTTKLTKITPPYLKVLLGISNETIEHWKKSAANDEHNKQLLKTYMKAEKQAIAFLVQDLSLNPKDSAGKLAIIKAYAKEFKDNFQEVNSQMAQIHIKTKETWGGNE